jgi:integrase
VPAWLRRVQRRRQRTESELRRFLDHVQGERLFAVWRLAAATGMRRGELLGLTWREFDADRAVLRVSQQLIPTRGGCTFGPPKSRRSERTVALDPVTVEALKRHREVQMLERTLAGTACQDGDLVFANEIGAFIHPQKLTNEFTRLRTAAQIPAGSLHILRHTHTTITLTKGVPLHVVAARIGDDPTTLLSTNAHLLPTSNEAAAGVIAAALVYTS